MSPLNSPTFFSVFTSIVHGCRPMPWGHNPMNGVLLFVHGYNLFQAADKPTAVSFLAAPSDPSHCHLRTVFFLLFVCSSYVCDMLFPSWSGTHWGLTHACTHTDYGYASPASREAPLFVSREEVQTPILYIFCLNFQISIISPFWLYRACREPINYAA